MKQQFEVGSLLRLRSEFYTLSTLVNVYIVCGKQIFSQNTCNYTLLCCNQNILFVTTESELNRVCSVIN
jgi:hypothetical protein